MQFDILKTFINTKQFQTILNKCTVKPSKNLNDVDLIYLITRYHTDTSSKLSDKQIDYILDMQSVICQHESTINPLSKDLLKDCTQNMIKGLIGHLKYHYRKHVEPTTSQINYVLQHDNQYTYQKLKDMSQFDVSQIITQIKSKSS